MSKFMLVIEGRLLESDDARKVNLSRMSEEQLYQIINDTQARVTLIDTPSHFNPTVIITDGWRHSEIEVNPDQWQEAINSGCYAGIGAVLTELALRATGVYFDVEGLLQLARQGSYGEEGLLWSDGSLGDPSGGADLEGSTVGLIARVRWTPDLNKLPAEIQARLEFSYRKNELEMLAQALERGLARHRGSAD